VGAAPITDCPVLTAPCQPLIGAHTGVATAPALGRTVRAVTELIDDALGAPRTFLQDDVRAAESFLFKRAELLVGALLFGLERGFQALVGEPIELMPYEGERFRHGHDVQGRQETDNARRALSHLGPAVRPFPGPRVVGAGPGELTEAGG